MLCLFSWRRETIVFKDRIAAPVWEGNLEIPKLLGIMTMENRLIHSFELPNRTYVPRQLTLLLSVRHVDCWKGSWVRHPSEQGSLGPLVPVRHLETEN